MVSNWKLLINQNRSPCLPWRPLHVSCNSRLLRCRPGLHPLVRQGSCLHNHSVGGIPLPGDDAAGLRGSLPRLRVHPHPPLPRGALTQSPVIYRLDRAPHMYLNIFATNNDLIFCTYVFSKTSTIWLILNCVDADTSLFPVTNPSYICNK